MHKHCGHSARVATRALTRVLTIVVLVILPACKSGAEPPVVLQGPTMGTSWSVTVHANTDQALLSVLESSIVAELRRINALMSTYDPQSELSIFNTGNGETAVVLHPDTLFVMDTALDISAATNGAYDVTLGTVIDLWGFGSETSNVQIPEDDKLAAARIASGYSQLQRQGQTVLKRSTGLRVDLSSLAKGYAVDQLGETLEAAGIEDYIAEIGGEVRTRGQHPDDAAWRIGIEQPDGDAERGLALNTAHVATSGSYRNYREVDGRRYSHIIDGRTGKPITHNLVAVTLLHDSTMLADAWATAMLVVGVDEALAFAEKEGLAMQATVRNGEQFEVVRTPSFEALLID